jgi:ABC-2 type transport system permease protein
MISLLRKCPAFIRRDFQIESSYKMNFLLNCVDSIVILIFFYFLNALMAAGGSHYAGRYGADYFSFVVIGVAFARYFQLTLRMFSESIRAAQLSGCLEAMLSSQTDSLTIVLLSSLYGLISGAVQPIVILTAAAVFMGVDFSHANVAATMLVLGLSILTFVAFGVLSAATILWLKKGDPLAWILGGMGTLIGGAYFPVEVLPVWLQKISFLIPITYSLDALRLTILKGYSLEMIAGQTLTLGLIAAILLPVSLYVFAAMVRKGRIEGTLTEY